MLFVSGMYHDNKLQRNFFGSTHLKNWFSFLNVLSEIVKKFFIGAYIQGNPFKILEVYIWQR